MSSKGERWASVIEQEASEGISTRSIILDAMHPQQLRFLLPWQFFGLTGETQIRRSETHGPPAL